MKVDKKKLFFHPYNLVILNSYNILHVVGRKFHTEVFDFPILETC